MENGSLIGALAIFTIGAALVIAIRYFCLFLRRSENREIAHRTLVRDDKSTATEQREKAGANDPTATPLKARLANSEASSHPLDPDRVKNGLTSGPRRERVAAPAGPSSRRALVAPDKRGGWPRAQRPSIRLL